MGHVARYMVGVDECGTGAWAGPFVVCALAVPAGWDPPAGVRDSKKFDTEEARGRVCKLILRDPSVVFYLDAPPPSEIDVAGLGPRHRASLAHSAGVVLSVVGGQDVVFDGNVNPLPYGKCEPKADSNYACVAAASIVGKVFRDRLMSRLALSVPGYGWDRNKGYGSAEHEAALSSMGVTEWHRKSYAPIRRLLEGT